MPGSDPQLLVLLVDTGTGALLGWEQVAQAVAGKALQQPAATSFQAYQDARWTTR